VVGGGCQAFPYPFDRARSGAETHGADEADSEALKVFDGFAPAARARPGVVVRSRDDVGDTE
jgi:hypothetical protein